MPRPSLLAPLPARRRPAVAAPAPRGTPAPPPPSVRIASRTTRSVLFSPWHADFDQNRTCRSTTPRSRPTLDLPRSLNRERGAERVSPHSSLQQARPPVATDQSEDSYWINVKHEGYLMRFGSEQSTISLRNTYCRSSSDTQPSTPNIPLDSECLS